MMLYLVLTLILAVLLHEIFHYIPHLFWSSRFNYFVMSRTSIGFLLDNDFMLEEKKLGVVFLFPFVLSFSFLIDQKGGYLLLFSLVNLILGVLDIFLIVKLLKMSPKERKRWADRLDEEAIRTAWYRKRLDGIKIP